MIRSRCSSAGVHGVLVRLFLAGGRIVEDILASRLIGIESMVADILVPPVGRRLRVEASNDCDGKLFDVAEVSGAKRSASMCLDMLLR